ncbi:MAG: hypothetical protein WKF96_13755 [Solirubrobacteraceae bacterium]
MLSRNEERRRDLGGLDAIPRTPRRPDPGLWREFAAEHGLDAGEIRREVTEEQARSGQPAPFDAPAERFVTARVREADVGYLRDSGFVQ